MRLGSEPRLDALVRGWWELSAKRECTEVSVPEFLTAQAVETADFSITLRGYDKDEVRAFLLRVADTLRHLETSADSAYQRLGEDIGNLLQDARDSADQMKRKAEEEIARRQEQAAATAATTIDDAQREAAAIRQATEDEISARLQEAENKVLELRDAEKDVHERLQWLRMNLQSVVEQLEAVETRAAASVVEAAALDEQRGDGDAASLEAQPQELGR